MARRRTRERIEAIERQLEELSHQLERQSDGISNQLELIKTMFTIKDPSAGASADAYEGLRRTVVLARENRMARLVDLARIDSAASSRELTSDLRVLLDELLSTVGVRRVESMDDLDLFDVFGDPEDGSNGELRLVAPAYVHAETGAVVRLGRCEHIAEPSAEEPVAESSESDASGDSGSPESVVSDDANPDTDVVETRGDDDSEDSPDPQESEDDE